MLIILSEKQFKENKKKLVSYKDYIIFDATGGEMNNFAGTIDVSDLEPSAAMIRSKLEDSEDFSIIKVEKMEEQFFSSKEIIQQMMAAVQGLAEQNLNVFLVFTKKAYKAYAETYKTRFEELYDVDFDFVFTFSDVKKDKKKVLKKDLAEGKCDDLLRINRKLEKKVHDGKKKKKRR